VPPARLGFFDSPRSRRRSELARLTLVSRSELGALATGRPYAKAVLGLNLGSDDADYIRFRPDAVDHLQELSPRNAGTRSDVNYFLGMVPENFVQPGSDLGCRHRILTIQRGPTAANRGGNEGPPIVSARLGRLRHVHQKTAALRSLAAGEATKNDEDQRKYGNTRDHSCSPIQ
jgi:hypothetical protein